MIVDKKPSYMIFPHMKPSYMIVHLEAIIHELKVYIMSSLRCHHHMIVHLEAIIHDSVYSLPSMNSHDIHEAIGS